MALVYSVSAGAPVDSDVVVREITVAVNGEVKETRSFGSVTDFGEFSFEQGDNVVITLVDIDDAENRSQPAECSFQAADTIPPAQPGSFGVTLVREE